MSDDEGDGKVSGEGTRSPASGDVEEGRNDELPTVEVVTMVVSVLFTLALFGFALWQAVSAPGAVAPSVNVTSKNR